MKIPIEDNFEDVLIKAAVGKRLGHSALAVRSGLSIKEARSLIHGNFDERALRKVAPVLALDANKLVSMAKGDWYPQTIALAGLKCINTPFPEAGYTAASVNNFLIFDPQTGASVVFDTGANADELLRFIETENLELKALFLTHTHRDHIPAFSKIMKETGCATSYAPAMEPHADARPIDAGETIRIGPFRIEVRLTNGHSRGGLSYVVDGLATKVAIVGDSLFSLSMGGAKNAYYKALKNNREQILSLPWDTIICPGHGPMTTVGEELEHNPFF